MTANEILTLTFSASAIVISIAGLYIQFLRKKTKANFRLISISYSDDTKLNMNLCYMVSNYGNLDLLLSAVSFVSGNSDKGTGVDTYMVLPYKCDNFPTIIEKDKIKQVFISVDSTSFDEDNDRNVYNQNLYAMFEFVSANGKKKDYLHDVSNLTKHQSKDEQKIWELVRLSGFDE